jgi:prepilin peptidase CpaA
MPRLVVDAWPYAVLAAALIVSAVTDVRRGRIYNAVTYPAIVLGLVGHTLMGGLSGNGDSPGAMGLWASLAGMAMGLGPMLLAWIARGIGGGDVKLMAAVGALGGWRFTLSAMFYGFAVAAILAIAVILRRKIARKTLGRVWRFLCLIFTPAGPADPAGAESPKIPFGLALCVGSGIALAEAIVRGDSAVKWFLGI